jgi:hypothetical protein
VLTSLPLYIFTICNQSVPVPICKRSIQRQLSNLWLSQENCYENTDGFVENRKIVCDGSEIDYNIFDICVDFLTFIHFHYMKIHRLLSSLQRRNIFRQDLGIGI